MYMSATFIIGLVNAHTETIEKSWDNLQFAQIKAIVGNRKIGSRIVNIDVERSSSRVCKHKDSRRRIEVSIMKLLLLRLIIFTIIVLAAMKILF